MPQWRDFERIVAMLQANEYADQPSFTVIPNARITGIFSGRKRQIDVLIDYRYDNDLSRRIIIDAKQKKRPIDVKEVESFEGMMKDVGASRGILVCSNGHTNAALRRAQQHIGIRLLQSEEIESLDLGSWDSCRNAKCSDGLVLWDATPGIFIDGIATVQAIGKCDECGLFHVWCWGCGNRKSLGLEVEWQCGCKGPWFWLTSIEEEVYAGLVNQANYLILVAGMPSVLDRRPL